MRKLFLLTAMICVVLISCKKESAENKQAVNSWTFKVDGTTYKGTIFFDAQLNTILQSNDTYTLSMLGFETSNTDRVFNVLISLADTTFSVKDYKSGIAGSDHLTSFYFTNGVGGDEIFKSTNTSPGPIINFQLQSFDQATSVLTFTFSGNVMDDNGTVLALTDGKVVCHVEKM